jgi:hypothetical protein
MYVSLVKPYQSDLCKKWNDILNGCLPFSIYTKNKVRCKKSYMPVSKLFLDFLFIW